MGTRNAIAIDLGRRRLRAVQAARGVARRGVSIARLLVRDVPAELDYDDPAAVGRWLADCLREAGFRRGNAILSIGREHVGLKRITLPTIDPVELPDMTRLAMQRELPFDADSAVIDFMPVERHETSTTVLAVAVPNRQVEFMQAVAAAAGIKVERIALRTMGTAALMNALEEPHATGFRVEDVGRIAAEDAPAGSATEADATAAARATAAAPPATLAVDVVGEGVEFCVLSEGSIRFSRAAETPAPQDELAMAETVVTEARRTWMSYRVGEETGGIGHAVIMGDRRVAEYAAGPVGEMLKMPVRVLHEHPRVEVERTSTPREDESADLSRVWPLVGLLLERESGAERIDFLHPRRTPDVGARTRQRRLLAAAAVVVVGGAAFTLMRQDLQTLSGRAQNLVKQRDSGAAPYARAYRDIYKLEHLNQWASVKVDWLDHAMFLAKVAPPPDQIVLDSWSGALEFNGVSFDSRSFRWGAEHQATIVIDGEATSRATADSFRNALISNPIYVATTTGADAKGGKRMPFGFTYRLRTRASTPDVSGDDRTATPAAERRDDNPSTSDSNNVADQHASAADRQQPPQP